MKIRIPVRETDLAIEFDSEKISELSMPREVADGPDGKKPTGPSKLILEFATLEDAPKWVKQEETAEQ